MENPIFCYSAAQAVIQNQPPPRKIMLNELLKTSKEELRYYLVNMRKYQNSVISYESTI